MKRKLWRWIQQSWHRNCSTKNFTIPSMGPKHINASVLSFSTIIFSFKLPECRLKEGHLKSTALYPGVVLLPAAKGKLWCTGSTGLLRKMHNCEENPTWNTTSHRHHFALQGQSVLFHICTLPVQMSVRFTFIFTPMRTLCHKILSLKKE